MSTNKQIIHFYRFLDYEDLNSLNFSFNKPSKDTDSNIYFAKLVNPLYFYLPRSEILEVFQDDFSRNKARYRIDLEEHAELLEFCENLDALCVNLASQNSKEWFSKSLTSDVLIKYLQGLYDNIDEEITIDIDIDNLSHLDGLSEYNNDDQKNLLIKIDSIEFFKQTFRLKVSLDSIVDAEDIIDDSEDDDDDDDEMNFSEFLEQTNSDKEYQDKLEKKQNIEEIVSLGSAEEETPVNTQQEVVTDTVQEEVATDTVKEEAVALTTEHQTNDLQENNVNENKDVVLKETKSKEMVKKDSKNLAQENVVNNNDETRSISTSEVINNEVLNDLAENVNNKDLESILTKDEINEIEGLISLKNREKEKYLINAERAEKASKSLFLKAEETDLEIKSLSSKIKNCSSIGNSHNI